MSNTDKDDLLPEYDLERLGPGVRGKHYERYGAGANVVLIDPDLREDFPDSASVNRALREYLEYCRKAAP
jgi:hypothetical protein